MKALPAFSFPVSSRCPPRIGWAVGGGELKRNSTRPSPLKLGTLCYGKLDPRVAFTTAFAPYFAKVEVAAEKMETPKAQPKRK
jgi:hypothetical protein